MWKWGIHGGCNFTLFQSSWCLMDSTATSWLCMWELVHNIPLPWVKSDGPWMLHASGNQCGAHISIKLGHLNLVQIAVNPVQFPCNPVHSQALWGGQAVLHNHLNSGHSWKTIKNTIAWLCSTNMIFKGQQWLVSASRAQGKIIKAEEETNSRGKLFHIKKDAFYRVSLSMVKELFP